MPTDSISKRALALSLPLLLVGAAGAQTPAAQTPDGQTPDTPTPEELGSNGAPIYGAPAPGATGASKEVSHLFSTVPFGFLENRGQWDTPARFVASRGPARVFVEPTALTVAVMPRAGETPVPVTRFVFEGADPAARAEGVGALQGAYNFYTGGAGARVENVQRYEHVLLRGLYEGIDARLRQHEDRLEYDVLLAPGAKLDAVVVRCEGIARLELAADGRLLLHTAAGEVLTQSPPTTWAELPDGGLRPLDCHYVLRDATSYGYALPERADDLPVVIDPGLEWSTFLGGAGDEQAIAIDRDPLGRIVVAGFSSSFGWSLPGVGAPYTTQNGGEECYVAVLDPSASGAAQVVWWTYFGGSGNEAIWDVATNAAGQIFATGSTTSPDLPVTPSAFQSALVGNVDAFLTAFDPVAGTLVHSTYFGGSGIDTGHRILVAEPSIVTIGGGTESPDLPMTAGAFDPVFDGNRDAYFAIFDLSLSGPASLDYSTFVGGSGQDGWVTERQVDIARSASGVITLVTSSFSPDFPVTPNAYHSTNGGGQDPVLVEIDPSIPGSAGLLYGTFLGTPAGEGVSEVEIDPTGAAIITGFTYSPVFPTTPGAPFRTFVGPAGLNDAWLVKFDRSLANPLVYSTYLPGLGFEGFLELELDASGTAYGVGFTGSPNQVNNSLPVTCNAFDKVFQGPQDGFILALTPGGNGLNDVHYLSYFGGTGTDFTGGMRVESTGGTPVLRVVGGTQAADLPTTQSAFQTTHGGNWDTFATRIRLNPFLMCVANPNSASATGARLCASGSTSLAANSLQLAVTDLPVGSLGYFLMSTTEVAPFALPAPSQGALCLGGTIVRFAAFVQTASPGGTVTFQPNLANIPPPGAPLVPGDTAFFQYWFRDTGARSNTSSGVAVTFD